MAVKNKCVLTVLSDKWKKCCEYVEKIEKVYLNRDSLMDERVDGIIISLNANDKSSDISDDDESVLTLQSDLNEDKQ